MLQKDYFEVAHHHETEDNYKKKDIALYEK